MSTLRDDVLLALAKADGQPWASIAEATRHTAEFMYGKQADAAVAVIRSRIKMETPTPHAYLVEVLVNAGSMSEYWRIEDEVDPQPCLEDAEGERDVLIEEGFRPEHLRVVAISIAGGEQA